MITREEIKEYIKKIPPAPKALHQTIAFLNQGELTKAAQVAQTDLALKAYLIDLVNKPIYGFKNEVSDISQIFAILGVEHSQQTVYSYMISLLSPNKWYMFKLNKISFSNLQAELSTQWHKILSHLNIKDQAIQNSITLLPASIIVTEALFHNHKKDVELLRATSEIDLNTVMLRLCGMDLFDVCQMIAKKWDLDDKSAQIVQVASGTKPNNDETVNTLGKWMHLLLFFTLSKPSYIDAGLNDFIDFKIDFVENIYNDFAKLMDIQ